MDTIYFVKPLKTKTSKEVFEKVKEVYVELRNENLPVTSLHGDRAHEFFSAPLRSWALDRDVEVTRTEGQSPVEWHRRERRPLPQGKGEAASGSIEASGEDVAVGVHNCRPPAEGAEVKGRRTKESLPVWIARPSQTEGLWARGKI